MVVVDVLVVVVDAIVVVVVVVVVGGINLLRSTASQLELLIRLECSSS